MRVRDSKGFTLIELLIVVAIIGVVSAIAVPNLLNALDRGKQKRSMSDLRALAVAIETYGIDHPGYPVASDVATLRSLVDPIFIKHIPMQDGWNHDFAVNSTGADYTVGSEGKDGAGGLASCAGSPRCSYVNDAIIFADGRFVQWPEGAQN